MKTLRQRNCSWHIIHMAHLKIGAIGEGANGKAQLLLAHMATNLWLCPHVESGHPNHLNYELLQFERAFPVARLAELIRACGRAVTNNFDDDKLHHKTAANAMINPKARFVEKQWIDECKEL
uniref:Uncharacterized protein n=1 Tax=Romanomermis culicivorax TaxID=13658 RepID=A0A915HNQ3_ROMCU